MGGANGAAQEKIDLIVITDLIVENRAVIPKKARRRLLIAAKWGGGWIEVPLTGVEESLVSKIFEETARSLEPFSASRIQVRNEFDDVLMDHFPLHGAL
jgi:hypothetical protein